MSYAMFLRVWKYYPETAKKLLPLFAGHYGYWKELLLMAEKSKTLGTTTDEYTDEQNHQLADSIFNESINLMRTQLQIDLDAMAEYEQRKRDEDSADDDGDGDIEIKNETRTAGVDAAGTT